MAMCKIWSLFLWNFFMEEIHKKSIKHLQTGIQAVKKPKEGQGLQASELRVGTWVEGLEAGHFRRLE